MRKNLYLFVLLMITLLSVVQIASAQDATPTPVSLDEDVLAARLETFYTNLPSGYGTINVEKFAALLAENPDVVVVDVREPQEIEAAGTIDGAINIPLRTLGENLARLPDLDASIVVVCRSGFRATIGMTALQFLGYKNARVLIGGFNAWVGEDMPTVSAAAEVEPSSVPDAIDPALLAYVSQYLANLPEGFSGVSPTDLAAEMATTMPALLLDVRSDKEWADSGHLEGATHLWIDELIIRKDELPADKNASIVVYCTTSYRGGIAGTMLGLMGYTHTRTLVGGFSAWTAAGLPVVTE